MTTILDKKNDPQSYLDDSDPELDEDAKTILTQYSGVPEAELVSHVRAVRDKAFKLFPYPCIGLYYFMGLTIGKSPQYPDVLRRVKNGDTLLDLGCCFAQDLRRLVFDGAPAENLTGTELEKGFLDIGYELFKDKEKFHASLIAGDFFEPISGLAEHSFDIVHAASFFHLFSWDEQVETVSTALRLLKPKRGSMLFGRQTGVEEASVLKHPATTSGEMYRHSPESWKVLLVQVTQKLGIDADCEVVGYEGGKQRTANAYSLMRFTVVLK
ncbi:hypothetical protein LTR15_008463 [Elasticomyces elasticus]|nr:hypothetical protein LTR15_008463 [Elasticomyces elasticus]